MWICFWIIFDLAIIVFISSPFLQDLNIDKTRVEIDLILTLISSFLGILLNVNVLSVEKNKASKKLGWYVLILGFLYFFGKSIASLILDLNFLNETTKFFWLTPFIQFAWLFPSIMFFVANTYFAFKYCELRKNDKLLVTLSKD